MNHRRRNGKEVKLSHPADWFESTYVKPDSFSVYSCAEEEIVFLDIGHHGNQRLLLQMTVEGVHMLADSLIFHAGLVEHEISNNHVCSLARVDENEPVQ